jgi:hypothetical protein
MNPDHNQSTFSRLIIDLKKDGLTTASKKLDFLYRDKVWNNDSEFLESFGIEMAQIKAQYWTRMTETTQNSFSALSRTVLRIYPDLDL